MVYYLYCNSTAVFLHTFYSHNISLMCQDVSSQLVQEYLSSMSLALEQLAAVNQLTGGDQLSPDGFVDGSQPVCSQLTFLHIQQIIDQVNTAAG